ncbi:MAG: hypothetical protein LBF12_05220 [Christensenellaceae bacterium]|jgi:hypothetical protein|nr:hypothetical protein [Christensenellaceae bacterium]
MKNVKLMSVILMFWISLISNVSAESIIIGVNVFYKTISIYLYPYEDKTKDGYNSLLWSLDVEKNQ